MRRLFSVLFVLTLAMSVSAKSHGKFVRVDGPNLIKPDGTQLFIQGTNLGNWLNPEGYMFGFNSSSSAWLIDLLFKEMVGPEQTALFWKRFKDNYITRDDILFIREQGANTIRLPFNYKLFTDEDYMGLTSQQDGFKRIDQVVEWCREAGLYLILDMHDCPGGQTGDNIDDSYGYPWLFESEALQQLFCEIWQQIARHYRNEPVILGYELMNEPIPHFFDNKDQLNLLLEPLYKRAVAAIRKVDRNHVILLGGARWNSDFFMFSDWKFDNNIMYTCHRYGGAATAEAINDYISFRDRTGLPMYMGEFGHNSNEWQSDMVNVLKKHNIGYTFWPYKKVDGSCMMGIKRPAEWNDIVVKYSETHRGSYKEWREARPDQAKARKLLMEFADNCLFSRCNPQEGYIRSMGMK